MRVTECTLISVFNRLATVTSFYCRQKAEVPPHPALRLPPRHFQLRGARAAATRLHQPRAAARDPRAAERAAIAAAAASGRPKLKLPVRKACSAF